MDIADVLKEVPEVQLRILRLTWEVVLDDGTIDDKKVVFHQKELEEALKEAEAYSRRTAEAVRCLKTLLR